MANVCEIRKELFKKNEPRRLILKTPTTHLSPEDYTTSANTLINTIFPSWPLDPRILFPAMEIWGGRVFLAIDINNRE
ncbi:hypothetical protein HFD88_001779 [Aspergillus terreus]|nr:hypothetical protein HFD88_001779 [Aspergillus terreus]